VQTNKNLATLFQTLMLSIPAIVNVASVTFLAFFVYAVMGMNLFSKVKLGDNLTPHANFRSFWGSFMLLFRMSTGESYNGVMHDCRTEEEDGLCSSEAGDCGLPVFAEIYFLSFFLVSAMLMLNILVAIILDNYGDQEEQEQLFTKVGPEDMEVFKQVWAEKDPLAKGYVEARNLEWLLMHLPAPLGVRVQSDAAASSQVGTLKCARNKIQQLDGIPQCNGNVYFHHVLRELVKSVHDDVDLSGLSNNPRLSELDAKASSSKLNRKAMKDAKSSSLTKPNGEPFTVAESMGAIRFQTVFRGRQARKAVDAKKNESSAAVAKKVNEVEVKESTA